jgi:hypothetical protein
MKTAPQKESKKERQKAGRKPEILADSDRVERILNAIRLGLSIRDACEYAGIGTTSYYEIQEKAKAGMEPYASFAEQLKKAMIEREMRLLANLEQHNANWLVSAWRLERMFPEKYGRIRHELTGANGNPITIVIDESLRDI